MEGFEFIMHVATSVFIAGVAYGAIRSELKYLNRKFDDLERNMKDMHQTAIRAHERVDLHISHHMDNKAQYHGYRKSS